MAEPEFDSKPRVEQELLRLTFCGIVIASFFAALTVGRDLKPVLSAGGTDAATTILGLSAGFAFAYLISVASALKYQSPRRIDRFPLSAKVSQFFYDASINVFGVYVLFLLVIWLDSHFLHLPQTAYFWPLYVAIFSFTYVLARVVWALCQRAIEWQYDFQNKRDELLTQLQNQTKRRSK